MIENHTVFDELGVPTVVNAVGEQTRLSGTLMRPEAADAMREAADAYVHLGDLQARAGKLIREVTGAEAGYVTCGAASGLTLATAACMAGTDFERTNRLPNADDGPNQVIIPCSHRNEYEVAYRLAGAELVSVGVNDLGTGGESVEPWEIENAISEETAAVTYVERPHNQLSLSEVVGVAHEHGVPVIVDAAAELPPSRNLTEFFEQGADLVAFSGGKAIRGPQTTGILAGRRELVGSAALQHLPSGTHEAMWNPPEELIDAESLPGMPRHGIGRPMKVGKEEIVGLIRALELFVEEDDNEIVGEWNRRAERIANELNGSDDLRIERTAVDDAKTPSEVFVEVLPGAAVAAEELVRALREERPRVFVGERGLDRSGFFVSPKCLSDGEAEYLVERIRANLRR